MSTGDLPPHSVITPRGNERLLVYAEYQGSVRKLLWLRVSKDGSLYTEFCAPRTQPRVRFPAERLPDGAQRFSWESAAVVESAPNHEHMSFHASGQINSPFKTSFSVNLCLLTQRTLLCVFLPRHPDFWPLAESDDAPAAVIRDLFGDECPLILELYYQPAGELPIMPSALEKGVFTLPIGYEGVAGHARVLLHLVFRRQPGAAWAPYWTIAWPTIAGRKKGPDTEFWIEPGDRNQM